jgi:polysaccharide deacetylase family protein (PEP-CTERM system associated)
MSETTCEFAEGDDASNASTSPITNAMSVDVEDYFHVSAFLGTVSRDDWDRYPHRVEKNTEAVLALFNEANVVGTFFVLGWVAERYPSLVRRIANGGHEIASHGFAHWRVGEQTPTVFREDIARTKRLLEDVSGVAVNGYRAASFSLNDTTMWAYDALVAEGYTYSSSIYPIRHDHYGAPQAPRFPFTPRKDLRLTEVPVTTTKIFERNFPCGGGGYFRFLPYPLSAAAIRRVNRVDQRPCVFYFHPWEIDPDQPRIRPLSRRSRFRHYVNLERMQSKLRKLLIDFGWGRVDRLHGLQGVGR